MALYSFYVAHSPCVFALATSLHAVVLDMSDASEDLVKQLQDDHALSLKPVQSYVLKHEQSLHFPIIQQDKTMTCWTK
jgi:hypothetical protein